jgi:anti-sigma regulatory factor (Ser/Thr protein kinase)
MTSQPERSAAAGNTVAGAGEPCGARHVTLPSAPPAAGLARGEVRDALALWGLERLEDTALLLASELVSNAVRHARHDGSELGLRIADTGAWLRIEVSDADPRLPLPQSPAGLDETGFGLVLVEALAAKWGVDQAANGKTVWIELDTRPSSDPDNPPARNQATARRGGARQGQPEPCQLTGEVTVAVSDDERRAAGAGGIPAAETALVCRSAAALIHGLGWDPLAESWNTAGPLPMDIAIFRAAEARGHGHLDDILDVVLTHIAGSLYAAGEVTRQMLVHDMPEVAMAWEARPGRTAGEVLTVLGLTATILDGRSLAGARM